MRLLAIDVGTQSARAIVFDECGALLARAQVTFERTYDSPHAGWAEQEPEVYWQAVADCCKHLWSEGAVKPGDISGLALTTQRGTVVCVDRSGTPLRPAILWLDQRLCADPPSLGPIYGTIVKMARAGDIMRDFQMHAQANWLARNEPELWRATDKFLLLSGWLSYRLTGAYVDSSAAQVGYVPFDFQNLKWEGKGGLKWRGLALEPSQLPKLVHPGSRIGTLQASAADALGLPANLPVIAAAADKACEVLGCGVLEPGMAQLSFGTTATINAPLENYLEIRKMQPAYPAAVPGKHTAEIQIFRGFWMVSWFRREFAYREETLAAQRGVAVETLFDELISSVPAGSMGLTLQPYWSPGIRDPGPEAKGAIVGFGDVHTRAHLYRSIIEGLAYGLRAGYETIVARTKRPASILRVAGGGSQSDAAMQITADVFGLPAERAHVYETSALGAAMNAAVGLGLHADYGAAVRAMTRPGRRFEPDATARATYDLLYRDVYSELYPRLQPIYEKIRSITNYPPMTKS